jgi:hypothetical protein
MKMRSHSAAACLLLLANGALAQLAAPRFTSAPVPLSAPAAFLGSAGAAMPAPALAAPAFAAAAPVFAAAPALANGAFAAAASGPDKRKGKDLSAARASAAALSEFSRLVADLMGEDAARSKAAADGLNKLKDAHLNGAPDPQRNKVLELKPMQIPAGMYEVQDKAALLRGMKKKDSDAWLRAKSVPFVEDYKGRKRMVDHHHEARAAWEADLDEVFTHRYFDDELHGWIKGLSREQYYAVARAMGLFYDLDQFGAGPHDPNHLPEDVRSLADDPYRSIAWQVRKRGGFGKSSLPFAEFQWAHFFRERVRIYPTRADFDKAVAEAMAVVHDPAARSLPGSKPQ